MFKKIFSVLVLSFFVYGCSTTKTSYNNTNESIQVNTSNQFLFYSVGESYDEKYMNKETGFQKAYFYTIEKENKHFYPWWITADFSEDKLMKNVILHFPVKIHFAGLHESVVQIKIPSDDYAPFPLIMHRWANTFRPVVINNQAIPVIDSFVNDKSLTIKLSLPISLFFNNVDFFNGICEFKDSKFLLKNGICRFLDDNNVYVTTGNLLMGFSDYTNYGLLKFEKSVEIPTYKDYDFGEVLIWDDKYIIYGKNFDSIVKIK